MADRKTDNLETLTEARVRALETPKRRTYHYDAKVPGLALCASPAGSKTWYVCGRWDGKFERFRLDAWPKLTVDAARKAAQARMGEHAAGRNPADQRRASRAAGRLADAYQNYETYMKLAGKRWTEIEYRWRLHIAPHLGAKRIDAIRRADVVDLHRKVAQARGKVTANRAVSLLRAIYNRMIDDGKFTGANPAAKIERFHEGDGRTRFLDNAELKRLFLALRDEPNDTLRDFFLLALFTAQRRGNVQRMRWDQLELGRRTWTIPDTQSKNRKTITVNLSTPAIQILEDRQKRYAAKSEWVFPSRNAVGKHPHLTEPKTAWDRITKRAKLKDVRIHDLRRTLASHMAMEGVSLQLIGQALGHADTASTKIYARLQPNAATPHVERIGQTIHALQIEPPKRTRTRKAKK
jgi:integrase